MLLPTEMNISMTKISEAIAYINNFTDQVPDVCLVLGSGLSDLADEVDGISIPYGDIPGFPTSTAPSHKGVLHIGSLYGCSVAVMQGRLHMYEGYTSAQIVFPMQVLARLGAQIALITNVAGGLNSSYEPSDIIVIKDHFSLASLSENDQMVGIDNELSEAGPVNMGPIYSPELISLMKAAGSAEGIDIKDGVYGHVVGPSFETPAEVRMLQSFGCDLVGMSTVPEVIAAHHKNLKVLALSVVVNKAISSLDVTAIPNEEEIWEVITAIKPKMKNLIRTFLKQNITELT